MNKAIKIKDATLIGKRDILTKEDGYDEQHKAQFVNQYEPYEGDINAEPMEMSEELREELLREEEKKDEEKERVSNSTKHYDNGYNIWRLISKTWNEILGWEHVTTAMEVPGGVLVCVKESIGNKMHSTMTFVPGAKLTSDEDKYHIS